MEEEKKYNGWLISDNILKRSFAVMGHNMLATVIIYAILGLLFLIMGFMVALFTL